MVVLLTARDLAYAYRGEIRALHGVSVDLGAGELLAVLGPNGSGKSTLIKLFGGLLSPDTGRVILGERDLASLTSRERARQIAVVPQVLDALPELQVQNFVMGGRYAHFGMWRGVGRADRRAVDDALRLADVGDLGNRLVAELSGGQRQRVLVARALAQESEVLLCDEPTASLDPEHQLLVLELLEACAAQGKSVVFVTHDLNLASQFGDRALLLDAGVKVAEGAVAEVLCPEVLSRVYGDRLLFEKFPGEGGRPIVLPWRESTEPGSESSNLRS